MTSLSLIQTDQQIKTQISDNLDNISEQPRNYIKDIVVLINREIGINKILSIILFGSLQNHNSCETSNTSDCDLLIIFKDRVSNHHLREVDKYFLSLELKHDFREFNSHFTNKVLFSIQQTTGMFVSHFLTKQKYWEQASFHRIFRVNRVISKLFAPRNIVLSSVIDNSHVLYGEDLRPVIKESVEHHVSSTEMIKSLIMNLCISIFSIGITLLKSLNHMKYLLEAVKWSLRASNYYKYKDSEKLKIIIERFTQRERPKQRNRSLKFYNKFLQLRANPQTNYLFMLKTPLHIIKIHLKALSPRKR